MARRWIGWKRSATNNTRPKGLGQVLASRASPLSGIAWAPDCRQLGNQLRERSGFAPRMSSLASCHCGDLPVRRASKQSQFDPATLRK
jgi:hypothetical protein